MEILNARIDLWSDVQGRLCEKEGDTSGDVVDAAFVPMGTLRPDVQDSMRERGVAVVKLISVIGLLGNTCHLGDSTVGVGPAVAEAAKRTVEKLNEIRSGKNLWVKIQCKKCVCVEERNTLEWEAFGEVSQFQKVGFYLNHMEGDTDVWDRANKKQREEGIQSTIQSYCGR